MYVCYDHHAYHACKVGPLTKDTLEIIEIDLQNYIFGVPNVDFPIDDFTFEV